jgi:hypothetical protein
MLVSTSALANCAGFETYAVVALAEDQLSDIRHDGSSGLGLVGNIVRLVRDNAQVGLDNGLVRGRAIDEYLSL